MIVFRIFTVENQSYNKIIILMKPISKMVPFAKARKRIETDFSQMCDQFMICRNYAKQAVGLFARIIGKISAFTAMQYLNLLLSGKTQKSINILPEAL